MYFYKRNTWKPPKQPKPRQKALLLLFSILFCGYMLLTMNFNEMNLPALGSLTTHDTVIYAYASEAETLDPALAKDPQSAKVISCIFEGLVRFKPGTTEIEPCLATAWQISSDGKEYTFTLRKNIKFHDGTPFNAHAVKYSIERQLTGKQLNYYPSMVYSHLKEVKVINDYTVKFILTGSYAPLLRNLAIPLAAPITSPAAVSKYGSLFSVKPVGTGPYVFQNWDKGNSITLSVNPHYWGVKPGIKKLIFKVEPQAGDRLAGLIQGTIQLADGFTPQYLDMLRQKNIPVLTAVGTDISYLGFFTNKKLFNPKIREAVSTALNRSLLVEYGNSDVPLANSILPPGVLQKQNIKLQDSYNPTKAKKLLKEAGYPEGIKLDLITYREQRPYNTTGGELLARSIQKQLEEVNIKVNIKTYAWSDYKKALYQQEGDAFLYGWISDSGDPDDFLYHQFSSKQDRNGLNISHYNNSEVNQLLDSARECIDPQLRGQYYSRIMQILFQDRPWIPLNHSLQIVGISPTLKGCIIQRNGTCFLNELR